MGYEIRLHIAQEWGHNTEDYDREFGRSVQELAVVDLSKPGSGTAILALIEKAQKLQAELIEATGIRYRLATVARGEDGDNIYVSEDEYGKPLAAIPLRSVHVALLRDYADSIEAGYRDGYRRFAMAITLIEQVIQRFPESLGKNDPEGRPLVALAYGH